MKKTPENSSGKNSAEIDLNSGINTGMKNGSMVYNREASEDSNQFDVYMKMLRDINQKYEGDRQVMENELAEICRHLSFNQRQTDIGAFVKKKDVVQAEMAAEIARVTQRYQDKLAQIDRIIEYKQQIEFLRT